MTKVIVSGLEVDFVEAVNSMDNALRKALHATFERIDDDRNEQRFVDRYCDLHRHWFSTDFVVEAQPEPTN